MREIKYIDPKAFCQLDLRNRTLVDVRNPDEVLIQSIPGAINIPLDTLSKRYTEIPKNKPVIVYCKTGIRSEKAAAFLAEQEYDVTSLNGGIEAYLKYEKDPSNTKTVFIDAKQLKCPGPIVKVADAIRKYPIGTHYKIEATEDAFASDIKVWCERTGNHLDSLDVLPDVIRAEITSAEPEASSKVTEIPHGKTFVVFSGDLDKTIAAFIMANGAAAMGREVTMFFTFWGLNILRRPEKVAVHKTFIEKMFGIMMPRGTKKLGLSRMNMGGLGAKMIRGIMKDKGITPLEQLIQDAIDHGVHLVACQMSMDIMGIHQEELIDGVELGGVSTFLGSGEKSDMSLFI